MLTSPIVTTDLISIGVNRDVNGVICINNQFIHQLCVFAAYKSVAIYDIEQAKILTTLQGHNSRVNAVSYLLSNNFNNDYIIYIISGSVTNQLIVWQYNVVTHQYSILQKLTTTAPVVSITATTLNVSDQSMGLIVYSCSNGDIDSLVKYTPQHEYELLQRIHNKYITLSCSLTCITHNTISPVVLLCTAGIHDRIDIHLSLVDTTHPCINEFIAVTTLEGHTDWIHNIDLVTLDNTNTGVLLLSSASQDKTIRLWKFQHTIISHIGTDEPELSLSSLNSRTHHIKYQSAQCSGELHIQSESILHGHENWVMSARWIPRSYNNDNTSTQQLTLLSSSTDKTMIVWSYDTQHSIWNISARVGELGGHTLGFYGANWGSNGNCILANGYSGCFQRWNKNIVGDMVNWESSPVVSGHTSSVCDITFDTNQQYIMSASTDQTTRCYAQWNNIEIDSNANNNWYEIARPQIHGYNLNCITSVNQQQHMFVSGADEKIMRVFYAPIPFIQTLHNINKYNNSSTQSNVMYVQRALKAHTPELGLSNKANTDTNIDNNNQPVTTVPPSENYLISHSLWPEIEKLYGHGYEIVSLTCNHSGTLLASASIAKQQSHAVIRLWNTNDWSECNLLHAHQLTVVQLQFSHNDKYLLSVSRDRHLALFHITQHNNTVQTQLIARIKAHTRIIWCCSWSYDDQIFATGARDKYVKIWRFNSNPSTMDKNIVIEDSILPIFTQSITAVSFAPNYNSTGYYILAVGMEDGSIEVWTAKNTDELQWNKYIAFDLHLCPTDVIRKLIWRINDTNQLQLAACSDDHSVRLYTVTITIVN